jgi:hypothetical protein
MGKLKLIWDFRGDSSLKIAEHHAIHLKEYVEIEKLNITIINSEQLTKMHAIAYLVCEEQDMKPIRNALKPHRGQFYND